MPHYQSADGRFGIQIGKECLETMLKYVKKARVNEIGGILIGYYNDGRDLAVITHVTGPPKDSRSGRTWFERGLNGLQELINFSWKNKRYYLGEWHFHPYAPADPSFQDKKQMIEIAKSKKYCCPEPLLLILGGSIADFELKAFVASVGNHLIPLLPENNC